ncbi:DNA ligase, putative [Entamoeba dispar SAW760]|uniref:DNA ligase n=1 Tax=Entamoeba dispar (strain ATCC PRA-260 / SAW760) TaxID=370354 RepID=B0E8U9_ENTDS|nr:DNA ligase, putative [Entamoeba dispar SAW760]EDR29037.1 DNA ligase, putative [Entamoeba dispar SAW760]|eukprot:EDR29037.1 DNA ligase, putative [Entamoeba dispar SAW760]
MSKRQSSLSRFFKPAKRTTTGDQKSGENKVDEKGDENKKEQESTEEKNQNLQIKEDGNSFVEQKVKTLPFKGLADCFDALENETGKLKKREIYANYLKTVIAICPNDLTDVLNLTTGQIAPTWEGKELGIGDAILKDVVKGVTGLKLSQLNDKIRELGDIGIVAQNSKKNQKLLVQPKPLTIQGVVLRMKEILEADNSDVKKNKITALLVAAIGNEIRFILRILKGVFRIGFTDRSLPPAIAQAVCSIRKENNRIEELTELITNAVARVPSFQYLSEHITANDPFEEFAKTNAVQLFIPFRPMLAKPKKSVTDITSRFKFPFTAEYKYDGERGQIHFNKNKVMVFTRNLENYTEKYPDVIEAVKEAVNSNVQSFIIDCEIVAFNRETNEFQEFQILGRRAKKGVSVHSIAINVCVNVFDIVYLNGKDLMDKPLKERRDILHSTFHEVSQRFLFARFKNIENEEDILPFFEEAINHRTEGLMCKTLVYDAEYIPDKRTDTWYKLKKDYLNGLADTVDLVPVGAWMGEGKRAGVYGAFLLACRDEDSGDFETVTKVGTGFSDEALQKLYEHLKTLECKEKKNVKHGDNLPDVWFEPKDVWEIKGADLSLSLQYRAGIKLVNTEGRGVCLRFPRYIRTRDDKEVNDITTNKQIYDLYKEQPSVRETKDGQMKIINNENEEESQESEEKE